MKVVLMLLVAIASVQVDLSTATPQGLVNNVLTDVLGIGGQCVIKKCPTTLPNNIDCVGVGDCDKIDSAFGQNAEGVWLFPCDDNIPEPKKKKDDE